jgi:hypothetical protein
MDYKNGVIYKIVCKDTSITDCYVGSSCSPRSRKCQHKKCCTYEKHKAYNLAVYRFIRDNGGWLNWSFIIIEKYPCEDKTELIIRERYWFERLNASLNDRYPQRSKKEYREKNKEVIAQKYKEYREKNKEVISQKYKEYRENNKEILAQKNKEYREKNKEKIAQKDKEYREKNKEKIAQKQKQKQKEKVECDNCGSISTKGNLTRHKRSLKCQNHVK